MKKIRIGVVGCGHWGPNQIRAFFFNPNAEVVRVCDLSEKRLASVRSVYKQIDAVTESARITRAEDIDAVVVTTPVRSHFGIVRDALEHGKDVLCEKPMTVDPAESEALVGLASSKGRILMVGHVFLYNPGILKIKDILKSGELGRVYYAHAKRTNLGPVRNDVNAVYDLASHDISIFNFLFGGTPRVVEAVGQCFLQQRLEDVAFVSLEYPGGILAHIHVSWLDPKKARQITVVGDTKMATWDDLASSGPVEIFSKRIESERFYGDFGEFQLLAKEGDVVIPNIKAEEPLRRQAEHFVECVLSRKKPLSDGADALAVVRTLAEIEDKLRARRASVALNS